MNPFSHATLRTVKFQMGSDVVIMSTKKVVVAMSGGVDSSVAAALLVQEGYEVIGITMRLWTQERDDLPETNRTCCGVEAVEDAQAVAQELDIPYYLMNFERPFQTHVVDYFTREYSIGRTPNPCLACNQYVKFDNLLEKARALGASHLATGHYARVHEAGGSFNLLRGIDTSKDQSYVLYTLGQPELRNLLLPVGHYTKPEIRQIARQFNLPVADKPESQDICFIPDRDYRSFVAQRIDSPPGDIVSAAGEVLGRHRGIAYYTVGQRHGLGLPSPDKLYVTRIDAARNRVVVGPEEDLYSYETFADDVHFVRDNQFPLPIDVSAKIRYKSQESPATLFAHENGVRVVFREPQRAITPGQAIVFYQGDEVIGGARIASPQFYE